MRETLCDDRGPRIGSEGAPRCRRPKGHDGEHRPNPEDGWGDVRWSNWLTEPARPVGGDTREALRVSIIAALAGREVGYAVIGYASAQDIADAVLALPAVRAALDAQETVRRVRRVSEEWGAEDGVRHLPASRILGDLRRALAGDS